MPLICYETLFPALAARAMPRQRNGTVLVGLSNDARFGSTCQPLQPVSASILRAVENRVPFVHVPNNGPSVAVLPNGRVLARPRHRFPGTIDRNCPIAPPDGVEKTRSGNLCQWD
ncbi:MAG: nitrilase-related carbon-nitrogen hydrolase [Oleiphilaceae bacterium]|nr:nitrilase-related carbon-nitrogen hydrolase [Oleiphilaceae bacterium]